MGLMCYNEYMRDGFSLKGKYRLIKTNSKTGEVISVTPFYKNLVVDGTNTGFNLILQRLYGTNTYSLNITHLDIGTGTNLPALSDTQLQTALARTVIANKTLGASSITFRFFIANVDLPNADYTELGLFIDGSAGVNTGNIFTRSLLTGVYSKEEGEDTTIEYIVSKN